MAKTKAVAPAKAKPSKGDDLDELNGLVAETAALESENRDVGGRQYSYLKILGNAANDPIMKAGKPEYIKGAKEGCWVIPTKKLNLGTSVTLTILGMFKVFEDSIPGVKKDPKSKQEPMRQVVGYWMPQDAENIPVEGIFERPYTGKDGTEHILKPVHWAFIHLHDHPEIEDALLTFRSTGNSVYKELQKLIAGAATTSTELRLTMTSQEITSKSYDRDYLYPLFEIDGRNYDLDDNGKIKLLKDGMDKDELTTVIKASHAMQTEYAGNKMVAKKTNLAAIVAGAGSAGAIEDKRGKGKAAEYADDDDDEGGKPAKF